MDLEVKNIYSTDINDFPPDVNNFIIHLYVEIGERNKEGAETFHFTAASSSALQNDSINGLGFNFLRGYILLDVFDWAVIRRAIENLIDHARSRETWGETISFLNRYGIHDSEDIEDIFYS